MTPEQSTVLYHYASYILSSTVAHLPLPPGLRVEVGGFLFRPANDDDDAIDDGDEEEEEEDGANDVAYFFEAHGVLAACDGCSSEDLDPFVGVSVTSKLGLCNLDSDFAKALTAFAETASKKLASRNRQRLPTVYDRDNPPRLPASAFKPGDRVRGKDEGGWHTGKVSNRFAERDAREGDVLVWFDGEEYEPGALGNLVKAELLMLWPDTAHRDRLFRVATGEDLDRTAAGVLERLPGETDARFRSRALGTWVMNGRPL